MDKNFNKYAHLLLTKGLCINEHQPLVISADIESIDFVRILTKVACKMNIKDIYYDWQDEELKHTQLEYFNDEEITKSRFWDKSIHEEYAKKDAAFLFLISGGSNTMKDIDTNKLKVASNHSLYTRKLYRDKQANNEINWCIASVATKKWADIVFPNEINSYQKLWDTIFDICFINTDNPEEKWTRLIQKNNTICEKLTNLNIKTMHYKSNNGTDLKIELPKDAIWHGGSSEIKRCHPIVNIPTVEVFTTPNKYKTNGVVYASKPLVYSGIIIKDIMLEFTNGKVSKYDAKEGLNALKNILTLDQESSMLGEVALVDKNTKISKTNILFYETLYDENASCHIAVGRGFKECIKDGNNMSNECLENIGYNNSKNHVDIMIGTEDLSITIVTYDNKEIELFKQGSFNI